MTDRGKNQSCNTGMDMDTVCEKTCPPDCRTETKN